MQPQAERPVSPVGTDGAIGKRGVADGEIVDWCQTRAGKIALDDPRPRLQQAYDACRDRINLDPGDIGCIAVCLRHERGKQARPNARL